MSWKRIALIVFLLWEAWWAYVFVTAPIPDEEMRTVFAVLMGVFLPLAIGLPLGLVALGVRSARRARKRERE